jgi:nicotinamide-nucleotide amidase
MFFQGGITVYNLGQKSRHLKVDPIAAESCNCVSQKITDAMALECINLFSSDWAIAITGYAAPIEELGIEELFAFISIAFRGKIVFSKKLPAHEKNPLDCQIFFTNSTLAEFQQLLKTKIQVGSEELIRN